MRLVRWISGFVILAVTMPVTLAGQDSQAANRAEARKVIQAGNVEWGKARVAHDKGVFDKMMAPAPDFYVRFSDGRRMTRQEFFDRISIFPRDGTLTRFDAAVLTVEPNGDDWVALIFEKLEIERKGADGKTETEYIVSITRDGWRKVNSDKWLILFSEQVSQEHWKGTPPPLANW
jgi:hypothetical protein